MNRLLIVALVLTTAASSRAQELTLAARHQPAGCNIVRAAAASPSQIYAAEELQRFAEEMTGVKLPITTDEGPLKNIRLSEDHARHDQVLARWKAQANPPALPAPQSRALVEDKLLSLSNRGTYGDTVADAQAVDGSAMKLYNTHYEWCATLPFSGVAFDPGRKYRLRMRACVEKEPGKQGEAFWVGVYDDKNLRACGGIERKTSDVGEGYAWYDVAEWVPQREHYFWVGPGRFDKAGGATSAIKALKIDQLELIRLD